MSSSEWHLGQTSAHYESTGPGTISSGMGDHGGVFCDTYPFSTQPDGGPLKDFLQPPAHIEKFRGRKPTAPDHPPMFHRRKMKIFFAPALAISILCTTSAWAQSFNTPLPSNVSLYAKPGIGDGQQCLVGVQTDDDGMNEKPVAYLQKSSTNAIWHASLPLPPHTYRARATHCAATPTTIYVLVQGDTQPEQSLSQTLLEVVALNRATGTITATKAIEPPNASDAHTAWVEAGDEHFSAQGKDLIVTGKYAPPSNRDDPQDFSLKVPQNLLP